MAGILARALWYDAPGSVALRTEDLPDPEPGEARIRMLASGISRGTERLILQGRVPPAEYQRMRAPMQAGDFPHPVKYGYCAVGLVEAGPADLVGERVFCLHPHQDVFNAPLAMLIQVPDDVPSARAVLAANMETALNALWDSGAAPADRIGVVGGGVTGLLVGFLAAQLPGARVILADPEPSRTTLAAAFGMDFAAPADLAARLEANADIVFHTSANPAGLVTALDCAGMEGTIIEMSWYGAREATIPLGGAFHSRRLKLISSQVGQVSPGHRPRWGYARRLAAALGLLRDARLDALVAESIDFADTPRLLPGLLTGPALGLAPVIRYPLAD